MGDAINDAGEGSRRYTPKLATRLLWWWGLVFIPLLPLVLVVLTGANPAIFIHFPAGLAVFLPEFILNDKYWGRFVMGFGLTVYALHFVLTLAVPGRKAFRYLILALIVIIVMNLVGCATMWDGVATQLN